MASDLSSGCNESLEVLDEREEGEISLEDVSSSEEGHLGYGYGIKTGRCVNCLSTQRCTPWCTSAKYYHHKNSNRKDTVQEKENRHYAKDSGSAGVKHTASTLQEKNDDLVPISSDSDMEIVGLVDNSKQKRSMSRSRSKKKKKKERNHVSSTNDDNLVSSSSINVVVGETTLKHNNDNSKGDRLSRSHRRNLSPLHRRSRITTKSPTRRHRPSTWFKMPLRKSKSPIMRSRSPVLRKSPRRLRSPKRSERRSPTRAISKKMSKNEQLPSSNAFNENVYGDVNKLLKKVRRLDSVRIQVQDENVKSKEHSSSLKEKLSNMIKGMSDNNDNVTNCTKEKMVTYVRIKNDGDDEEDLALLRQKALETKQKRNEKNNEQSKTDYESKTSSYDDDHDEEDLELRMIALRSAVLKKHQDRVQRGVKTKKYDISSISRSKSPFNQSFLDSISMPGETHIDSLPPAAQMFSSSNEVMHTEDMELDTDIEQEKEKLPYSPTDNITNDIPIDTHLLGMQTSDVSFINLNKRTNSPFFDNTNNQLEHGTLRTGIIENKSYLSNMINCANTESTFYDINTDAPYSPSDSIETSKSDIITTKQINESISTSQFSGTHCNITNDISSTNENYMPMDINMGQERPYSPTDAPIYDPDLSQTLPLIQTSFSKTSDLMSPEMMYDHSYGNLNILKRENLHGKEHVNEMETLITRNQNDFPHFFEEGSMSPNDSMVTIDDLPDADEVDREKCLSSNLENKDSMNNNPTNKAENTKLADEPLYMHGVPDVTKDINKIPTLINRTLVPATILKSNKQLQQPWPMKKHENHIEPTFKSAEMQPIPIDLNVNAKLTTQFKPMKLTSVAKKPQTILTTPVAFKNCLNDESINNVTEDAHATLPKEQEISPNISSAKSDKSVLINITDSVPKKKKRGKRSKRKNNNTIQNIKITISNENKKKFESDSGASGETNETMMNMESELPSSIIHKEQNSISNAAVLTDSDNVKLTTKLNQESNSHLSNEIEKDSIVQHLTNVESNNNSSLNVVNEHIPENTKRRRPSIDEDEEALRASLLASLAKRSKSSDISSCSASVVTTTATLSSISNVPVVQKIQQTDTAIPTYQVQSNNTMPHSLSQFAFAYNSGDEKNQVPGAPVPSTDIAKENAIVNDTASRLTYMANCNKKRPLPLLKGPTKKYLKKVSIPASTKVVNNAKKYQNTVVQKKLILQKAVSNYNADKLLDNKSILNIRPCENKWISNTKVISSDMQRIVINLGSDTEESDSDYERYKTNSISVSSSDKVEKRPILNIPTTEFERSVDQFLRDVRKKQENAAASKQTIPLHNVTKKNLSSVTSVESNISPAVHTPLAVRHLPVSKQEEYRRLKQQIFEREILKKKKTAETGTFKTTNNINSASSHSTMSDSLSKESLPLSKENPIGLVKTQNLNLQISIKNNNERNIEVVKRNTNSSTSSVIPNSKKRSLQMIVSNPSNAQTSNEKVSEHSNKIMKTTENKYPQDTNKFKIAMASLKVLTTDEVNHKLVQIQVDQHESDRTIMINNKTDLSERTDLINTENKQDNNVKKKKDDRIDVEFSQDHAKEHNEMNKENEQEMNRDNSKLTIEDINNLDTLNVNLSIEGENLHNKETTAKDQLLFTLVQDEAAKKDDTDLNLSNIESSYENDIILATNDMKINKIQDLEELQESIKKDVTTELNSLVNLPRIEQVRHLMDTEQKLVMKRYLVLDNLAEMSGDLRQWNMERDLQTSCVEEIKKLKEQLRLAEKKLQDHLNKINSIGPKVMDTRNKINNGRRECFKLSRICKVLGTRVIGLDYKIPKAGADLLENKLKEVVNHSRQLSQKKVPSVRVSEMHKNVIPEKQTEPEPVTELESESQPELGPEFQTETEPEFQTEIEPEFQTETESKFQTETEPEFQTETESKFQTETEPEFQTEPESEFQTEPESVLQTEPESVFQTEPELIEIEIPILENSVVIEQQDKDLSENNNIMISENGTAVTLTNTRKSLKQENEEEETAEESDEESKKRDSTFPKTNDIIRHDHYYDKTTIGAEYCIDNNLTRKNGDCDIIWYSKTDPKHCPNRARILQEIDDRKKKAIEPYVSMLTHLKPSRNTDPHGILCPYELMGTCNDGDCRFVHQSVIMYDHQSTGDKTLEEKQDCIDLDAVHFDHPSRSNARRWR
ncbi:PREDICTED: putative leucine-rich repeat-containing protein DDB_G0290503 [Polistes canadensis]|uniref:putative leucine-rich repeat-containing protein DDB_G0290503 n=1 Tax=Polistes canadensis TaxID=91411 RepID=UPI000718EB59|nr:PREDICTED: putative leucine-rich repeat-containing protein DDB_G0290503 [Polistes canadensis]XP_014611296.1 PREDICTED: putative leucine-rich repeat-containing protein DDB_G0290503 [Polistes canadensis]